MIGWLDFVIISGASLILVPFFRNEPPEYYGAMFAFGLLYCTAKFFIIPAIYGDEEDDSTGN